MLENGAIWAINGTRCDGKMHMQAPTSLHAVQVYNMISVRGDAVVVEYDRPAMDASLANDPRKSQVRRGVTLLLLSLLPVLSPDDATAVS